MQTSGKGNHQEGFSSPPGLADERLVSGRQNFVLAVFGLTE